MQIHPGHLLIHAQKVSAQFAGSVSDDNIDNYWLLAELFLVGFLGRLNEVRVQLVGY